MAKKSDIPDSFRHEDSNPELPPRLLGQSENPVEKGRVALHHI